MATVGGIDEFAISGDLDVRAGILCAIKISGQGAAGVKGLQLARLAVKVVGGDTVTLLIITIHDG